jgi:hypothetical protein
MGLEGYVGLLGMTHALILARSHHAIGETVAGSQGHVCSQPVRLTGHHAHLDGHTCLDREALVATRVLLCCAHGLLRRYTVDTKAPHIGLSRRICFRPGLTTGSNQTPEAL